MERRRFILTATSVGIVGLAGCTGDDDGGGGDDGSDTSEDNGGNGGADDDGGNGDDGGMDDDGGNGDDGGGAGNTEVTIEIQDSEMVEVNASYDPDDVLNFTVINENGDEVESATVLLEPGTAQGNIMRFDLGEDSATYSAQLSEIADNVSLRPDQNRGTYEFTILPPADSDWVDEQENPELVILEN